MTDIFAAGIDRTIGIEGGYSNDPNDAGGETMWGITASDARAWGYSGDMASMPRDTAVAIYRQMYVIDPEFDKLADIDANLAYHAFDCGTNCGPKTASMFIQRALNVLNYGGVFSALKVDGDFGRKSRSAVTEFYGKRGAEGKSVLLFMTAAQQSVYYIELAERSPSQEEYEYGWQDQRALLNISIVAAQDTSNAS